MPTIELPAGSHYALTKGIPDQYAGMTASMLQRSRAFVKYAGVDVTILTYDHRPDYPDVERRLFDRGAMIDGMRLANLWDDLRSWDDDKLRRADAAFDREVPKNFRPITDAEDPAPLMRERRKKKGRVVQVDYLRPDGTLLLSDRRNSPDVAERLVTLCDTSGEPIGTWHWLAKVYAFWFDQLPRDPVAWMIVDSKTSAHLITRYERPDVARLHVVRGSHLEPGHDARGELVESRKFVMENLDTWDSVTFLTKRQRDDVETRFGHRENLNVIPNSRVGPPELTNVDRAPAKGAMLASLTPRKRLGHAIEAMSLAKRRRRRLRPRLEIWGQGPLEADLKHMIKELRAPVKLKGHSPKAADAFSTASFSLLTSSAEAFGNVIIESMGRGCIPISYDIPYGPSDIITHGVDGFLVPFSDVNALADQICELITMPKDQLRAMREAGFRRAQDFNDERAVELWAGVMAKVAARRGF